MFIPDTSWLSTFRVHFFIPLHR